MPDEFAKIIELGLEIDVNFAAFPNSQTYRTAAFDQTDGKAYQLRKLSPNFMQGVELRYRAPLSKILEQGIPVEGVYCGDSLLSNIDLPSCMPGELVIKFDYAPQYLNGVLNLATPLLEGQQVVDKEVKHLPPSTVSNLTAITSYNLNVSTDSNSSRSNIDLRSVLSKAETNVKMGGYWSSTGHNQNPSINEISLNKDVNGNHKSIGLLNGYTLGSSAFGGAANIVGLSNKTSTKTMLNQLNTSDVDIWLTMPQEGRVEVFRDERLVNTQYLPQGLQQLDSTQLPSGVYKVEMKIYQGDTLVSTQSEFVYKMSHANRDSYQYWLGYVFDDNRLTDELVLGGSYLNSLGHGWYYGLHSILSSETSSIEASLDKGTVWGSSYSSLRLQDDGALNSYLGVQYEAGSFSSNFFINYQEHDEKHATIFSSYGTVRSNNNRTAYSAGYHNNITNNDYRFNLGVNHYFNIDWMNNWQWAADYGHTSVEDELMVSVSIPFNRNARISYFQSNKNSYGQASYSVRPNTDWINYASLTANYAREDQVVSGYLGFDDTSAKGSIGGSVSNKHNSQAASGFANMSGSVFLPGGMSGQSKDAGMLVRIKDEALGDLVAVTGSGTVMLNGTETLIPVSAFNQHTLTIDNQYHVKSEHKITNGYHRIVSYPGNVAVIDIESYPVVNIVGRLIGDRGQPLQYQHVVNHSDDTYTDDSGVFSLQVDRSQPTLTLDVCEYDLSQVITQDASPVVFIGDLTACDTMSTRLNQTSTERLTTTTIQPETLKAGWAVQYAAFMDHQQVLSSKWLTDIREKYGERLFLLETNDGLLSVITFCENQQGCHVDDKLMSTFEDHGPFIRPIDSDSLVEFKILRDAS